MGKTFVALALTGRYRRTVALVPASLVAQWRRVAARLAIPLEVVTHERLSRRGTVPESDLLIVDEAHRFRNGRTRRYDRLAARPGRAHLLLLTATPVVNHAMDLGRLLALFLPDNALGVLGLPSLERALAARDAPTIVRAGAAVIVARPPGVLASACPLPRARDAAPLRPPPIPQPGLDQLRRAFDALRFPTLGDRAAASLLRLHFLHRLASSAAACRETAHRHLLYLDRALAAAARGEALPRRAARLLVAADDDLQLELDLTRCALPAVRAHELVAERAHMLEILALLEREKGPGPKALALRAVLEAREGRRTIVFTGAVATAIELARSLGWRRVAVATGQGARVASGRVRLDEALRWFAPLGHGVLPPPRSTDVTTLIATDLASEGLDLQDADAIVHYDLPWTPARLEQRLGRIARLGSFHGAVSVWWFVPPARLEADLKLAARIAGKMRCQIDLGVAVSSRVGRARVFGGVLAARERIAAQTAAALAAPAPCFGVVAGPRATAFALRWRSGTRVVPELVLMQGNPPRPVHDPARLASLAEALIASPPSAEPPRAGDLAALRRYVRARLADAARGPVGERSRRLTRRVIRRAVIAARLRDLDLLEACDAVLGRLGSGVTEGASRALERALAVKHPSRAIRQWLAETPQAPADPWVAALEASLVGTPAGAPPTTLSS